MIFFCFRLLIFFSSFSLSLIAAEYTIDDKKLLELDEVSKQYDKASDINLEDIIRYDDISYYATTQKPKIFITENYNKTKLIHYFESYANRLSVDTRTRMVLQQKAPQKIYFISPNPTENYYGVNSMTLNGRDLEGRNLIGKMLQKMCDDAYIERIYQKIKISDAKIKELYELALEKQKPYLNTGWANIPNAIYFYNKKESYYAFTNFFPSEVYADGFIWPTSEHYYQAMKFTTHLKIQWQIVVKKTAREVYQLVRYEEELDPEIIDKDWKQRSLNTMIKIVWLKFNQHQRLKKLLLNTGDSILVEDTKKANNPKERDAFYGAGENYKGKNWLGCILMAVRDKLREQDNAISKPVSPKIPSKQSTQPTTTSVNPNNPPPKQITQSSISNVKTTTQSQKQGFIAWLWEWILSLFSSKKS
jgi:ribA/ribD-fused uncharacterized protein